MIKYGTKTDIVTMSFYLKVNGRILSGTNTSKEMVQIFIDADKNKDTGYYFESIGIGTDFMIEISGRNNIIESAILNQFNNSRESNNWNAWEPIFGVEAICYENELEAKIWLEDMGISENDNILVYYHIFDVNENHDFSDLIISNEKGALGVEVINSPDEFLTPGESYPLLTLDMDVQISDFKLNKITLEMIGTATDSDIESIAFNMNGKKIEGIIKNSEITINPSIHLPVSTPENREMSASVVVKIAPTATSAHTIGFRVKSIDSIPDIVTIKQNSTKLSYIKTVTDDIVIDGAFRDWDNINSNKDRDDEINDNVDIREYKATNNYEKLEDPTDNLKASFYLKVEGEMMAGVSVPARTRSISVPKIEDPNNDKDKEKPSGKVDIGNQIDDPLPIVTGEDTARIFLDTDKNNETGFPVLDGLIGADYMIKINGQYGIVSSEYFEYNTTSSKDEQNSEDSNWKKIEEVKVEAACGSDQLEVQVNLENIKITSEMDVYFHIIDWKGEEDYSDGQITEKVVSIGSSRKVKLSVSVDPDECNPNETVVYNWTIKDKPFEEYRGGMYVKITAPTGFTITDATPPSGNDGDSGAYWSATYTSSYAEFTYEDGSFGDDRVQQGDGLSGFLVKAKAPSDLGTYSWTVFLEEYCHKNDTKTKNTHVVPEFNEIITPITGIIVIFAIFRRKRRVKN